MMDLKFPLPAGASPAAPASRSSDVVRVYGANEQAVAYYLAQLEDAGFTRLMARKLPSGEFYAYTDGEMKLSVSFLIMRKEMRIFYEKMPNIPDFSKKGEAIYPAVTLTQFCTNTSRAVVCSTASGMGYVLRLTDGRLIVIDGGFHSAPNYGDDYPDFMKLLWDLSDGKKPRVALWMLTHPHGDHYQVMTKITEGDADVDAYMSTLPREGFWDNVCRDVAEKIPHYAEKNILAHAGDHYDFGDLTLDIYSSCEESELYAPDPMHRDVNEASIIFAFTIGSQKVLFVGDAYSEAEEQALAIAGGEIRCDICQIGHHGRTHHKDDWFYSIAAPKVALWPGCYAQIDNDFRVSRANAWILGELSTVVDHYVAFDGTRTLTFPYELQNLPYRSPLKK